jgi:hypothetical protein
MRCYQGCTYGTEDQKLMNQIFEGRKYLLKYV